jgi:hypothetical protein
VSRVDLYAASLAGNEGEGNASAPQLRGIQVEPSYRVYALDEVVSALVSGILSQKDTANT